MLINFFLIFLKYFKQILYLYENFEEMEAKGLLILSVIVLRRFSEG